MIVGEMVADKVAFEYFDICGAVPVAHHVPAFEASDWFCVYRLAFPVSPNRAKMNFFKMTQIHGRFDMFFANFALLRFFRLFQPWKIICRRILLENVRHSKKLKSWEWTRIHSYWTGIIHLKYCTQKEENWDGQKRCC